MASDIHLLDLQGPHDGPTNNGKNVSGQGFVVQPSEQVPTSFVGNILGGFLGR